MRTFQLFSALLFPVAAAVAQAGTLDPTFGTGGKAVANVPGTYCSGQALAQQADGKISYAARHPVSPCSCASTPMARSTRASAPTDW
ncbi:MAG: hypothetical protein IPI72_02470 [Flavobacteriales bacterium]|nr:hypothetical protein [Flavobacteriales bacterium]